MNPLYPKVRELVFSHHRNDDKHKLIEKILELLDMLVAKPPSGLGEYTTDELLAEIKYRLEK